MTQATKPPKFLCSRQRSPPVCVKMNLLAIFPLILIPTPKSLILSPKYFISSRMFHVLTSCFILSSLTSVSVPGSCLPRPLLICVHLIPDCFSRIGVVNLSPAIPLLRSWQRLTDIELQTTGYHKKAITCQLLPKPPTRNQVKQFEEPLVATPMMFLEIKT